MKQISTYSKMNAHLLTHTHISRMALYAAFLFIGVLCSVGNAWGTVLFHETFGSAGGASDWNYNTYSVKSGVAAVYANITSYSVTNARICKNSMGYGTNTGSSNTDGSAMMSTAGKTATLIIGPLAVGSYTSLSVTHYLGKSSGGSWGANDVMTLKYSTDNSTYTNVTRTGTTPTGAVNNSSSGHGYTQVSYSLPAAASSNTLYLKFEFYVHQTNKNGTEIGQCYIDEVELTGTAAASCSADPTIGDASLNGSFNMTSTTSAIGVASGTCSTGNAACDWTDYGFVWSDGANTTTPTVGGTNCNKEQVGYSGSATSWTGSITPSGSTTPTTWTTGHTYYVRTYGKNSKTSASYYYSTNALTFTPRSITFNSNGGSSVSTAYVNSGTSVTKPSDPTKTGYNFDNWYTTSGLTTEMNFSGAIVKDTTLYAKWTANKYDVTLSPNSGSGSDQTVSATYDADMPLVIKTAETAIVVPTRDGYDFGGYYDTDAASGGTQYYTYTGDPKALGSARTWDVANSTTTLYARWIPHQHKVSVSAVDHGTITATPAGGSAISEGNYNATVDYDKTITLGWTKDDHYSTLVWTVHRDGDESTTVSVTGSGNGATFTMPDYDVVVKATISEDPYKLVTFKNNGTAISGYEDVKVYVGESPSAPTLTDGTSGDACDATSDKHYGWTEDTWEYKISKTAASAKTIYKKGDNLPTVAASGDAVVYNAVWAEEVEGDDFEIVTSLSNIKEGKAYLGSYINYSSSWRWYMATAANESKTVTVSGTPKKLSSTSGLVEVTLVATATANQYYIKDGNDKYLYANNTGDVLEFSATSCAWTFSSYDNYMFVVLSSLGTYYMRGFASSTSAGGIRTYASSSTNSGICLFQKGTDLSNFMTHCCADLITLGTPSISNGTITYDWDSPIPTCNSGKTVTATITPSTGYKVTALTFSGGGVSYDAPDFPITSATNVTLTFAQNTDAATLSASATTAPIPVSSLSLRVQQTGQDDKTGDDLTMNCYPKEGQSGVADDLSHTLKVLFEEVLPSNALDKTYDWSVRVKEKGDADWTAVSFDGNDLTSNKIINYFNKNTGALQIKSTEGTAEIKITAHDGSGVTAKVTITVANVALSSLGVSKSTTTLYVGQSEAIDVSYTPLNTTTKGYTTGSYSYVTIGNTNAVLTLTGKSATSEQTETVTLTSKDTGGKTATVTVTVKPLPLVHFVDNVHNESFGDVVATTDGSTVTFAKTTPTHDDLAEPGTGNTCEKNHLHLIGWIRGDWPAYVAYMNGTGSAPSNSDLTGATGYFYAPGASITLTDAMHGKTFYAVWAKVE